MTEGVDNRSGAACITSRDAVVSLGVLLREECGIGSLLEHVFSPPRRFPKIPLADRPARKCSQGCEIDSTFIFCTDSTTKKFRSPP
jgi:hypothetical protein